MLTLINARILAVMTAVQAHHEALAERDRQEGQALVEYGLLIALIAVVCVVAITALGTSVRDQLNTIVGAL